MKIVFGILFKNEGSNFPWFFVDFSLRIIGNWMNTKRVLIKYIIALFLSQPRSTFSWTTDTIIKIRREDAGYNWRTSIHNSKRKCAGSLSLSLSLTFLGNDVSRVSPHAIIYLYKNEKKNLLRSLINVPVNIPITTSTLEPSFFFSSNRYYVLGEKLIYHENIRPDLYVEFLNLQRSPRWHIGVSPIKMRSWEIFL